MCVCVCVFSLCFFLWGGEGGVLFFDVFFSGTGACACAHVSMHARLGGDLSCVCVCVFWLIL